MDKASLLRHFGNILGWRTDRKIIVFESDDWGSIRMPSRSVYEKLLSKGIRVDNISYNRYDSLASEEDLTSLFNTLLSVKDQNGNPVPFTVNTVIANPDFDKIKESDFTEYKYEPFTETLKRYPEHQRSFHLWREGISAGLFKPQFHGREHLNVPRWMKALRENTGYSRLAFELRMFDLSTSLIPTEYSFMDSLNHNGQQDLKFQQNSIIEGTNLFEKTFGFRSKSFIAPCYIWSSTLNETLKRCGVSFFQSAFFQFEPSKDKLVKRLHYTGQKNNHSQYYLVRNVSFEPSENLVFDWVGSALSQIANAFFWHKPAIISSHRVNYIGYIDAKNRERNLILLLSLLKGIKKRWPDVEFMNSEQLGDLVGSGSQ